MLEVKLDDLTGPHIELLLTEHLEDMARHSPPESVHALNLTDLNFQGVTVWSAWVDEQHAGMGALKELDDSHGEIKSMRTGRRHLRQGVAGALLKTILAEARRRNYKRVSLETGSMAAFVPARKMYEAFGFEYCDPFGEYQLDANSVFMSLSL